MDPLTASNSLTDLAARIAAEHEAIRGLASAAVSRAMVAGDMLLEAKAQLKHGQWLPWLRDHVKISERTAQVYMRVARNRAAIESAAPADLTQALDSLAKPKSDQHEATLAEGKAIADRIRIADSVLMDEVAARMTRMRDFAIELYKLSPSDREKVLATFPRSERKKVLQQRHITDEDIWRAQGAIRAATE